MRLPMFPNRNQLPAFPSFPQITLDAHVANQCLRTFRWLGWLAGLNIGRRISRYDLEGGFHIMISLPGIGGQISRYDVFARKCVCVCVCVCVCACVRAYISFLFAVSNLGS